MVTGIVEGIAAAVHQRTGFPVYVDFRKQKAKFPCFYIHLLEASQEEEVTKRYWRIYDFDIQFFQDENGEVNDMQGLRDLADALFNALEYIQLNGALLRGTDMSHRVTDKVLHFFVTYEVCIRKVADIPKMENLELAEGVTHG